MALILVLVVVSAATLCTTVLFETQYEFALPSTVFAIILVLYGFGILNLLDIGFWLILASTVGTCLWLSVQRGSATLEALSTALRSPAVILFFVFALAAYALTRDIQLTHYDEFSHWGRIAKATFLNDALGPFNPVNLRFGFYTPGSSLFGYFVMKLGGEWREGHLFWAHQLLYGSLLTPFMVGLRWSTPARVLLVAILSLAAPYIVFRPLGVTLADPLVGFTAGYLFALIYLFDLRDYRTSLAISLGLSVLVLLKDTAALLVAVAVVMYLAKLITVRRVERQDPGAPRSARGWILLPLIAATATRLSWSILLRVTDSGPPADWARRSPTDLLDLLNGTAPAYWGDVASEFGTALVSRPLSFGEGFPLSPVAWFILTSIVMAWLAYVVNRTKRDCGGWAPLLVINAGAVAYTIVLLCLYFVLFSQEEALRVAGWERYVGTYVAALTIFVTSVLVWLISSSDVFDKSVGERARIGFKRCAQGLVAVWCCAVLLLVPVPAAVKSTLGAAEESAAKRAPFEAVAKEIDRADIGKGDRVMVVVEDYGTGYEGWLLEYLMIESTTWVDPDVGSKPGKRPPLEGRDLSVHGWEDQLVRGFDYVVLFSVDDAFREKYGGLFDNPREIRESAVYMVDVDADHDQAQLSRVN